MDWKSQWKPLAWMVAVFAAVFWLPVGSARFNGAVMEALHLVRWYAREHVLLCLVPAFFIAGAIAVFVSQASVMKYLGAGAKKVRCLQCGLGQRERSRGLFVHDAAAVCRHLPHGAGLGPATAFLYCRAGGQRARDHSHGARAGARAGIARAVGAVVFAVVIGLLMHLIFRREENEKAAAAGGSARAGGTRPLWQNALYFASMVGVLVFANWGRPVAADGIWHAHLELEVATHRGLRPLALGAMLVAWFGLRLWHAVVVALPTDRRWRWRHRSIRRSQ